MRVFLSESFCAYSSKQAQDALIFSFKWWKDSPEREFQSPFFGKDGGLIRPKVGGREYALRHCHLVPLADPVAKARWAKAHKYGSRKTSDRVLIYAQSGDDYYLIDVVDDPGAHEIMRMLDKQGRSFMQKCAEEADAFLSGQLALSSV